MRELEYPFDSSLILRKKKEFKRVLLENFDANSNRLKIALLGGSTTVGIKDVLEIFLLNNGIQPEFYESDYNKFYEDSLFSNPVLDSFYPDLIIVCTSSHNILHWPEMTDSAEDVEQKFNVECKRFEAVWEALEGRFSCSIIQANMEIPAWRFLGSKDSSDVHGRTNFINRMNNFFYAYAQEHDAFYIHDINTLSAEYGLNLWHNQRHWDLYKYAQSMEALPLYAFQLTNIILAVRGKSKKAIVVDADNTLWGGVIGDCGVDKIALGPETSKGQSFLAWQNYLKRLKDRGVLLLIASKNEEKNVLEGLSHPNSALKPEDFAAMAVNWNDKASNIQNLAKTINISADQMLFIDDNPAERTFVKEMINGISVLDANTPDAFITELQNSHFLEMASFSKEDARRTQMYHENKKRFEAEKQFSDYNSFLQSLKMRAKIGPFEKINYDRIAQLANKTNQFNLTGRRFSIAEIESIAKKKDCLCLSGALSDSFGDNGIVSLLFAHLLDKSVVIDNFLLSCRVFNRGMEYAMINCLIDECISQGITKVLADYIPTNKNGLVKSLYEKMGFAMEKEDADGTVHWSLDIKSYKYSKVFIEVD